MKKTTSLFLACLFLALCAKTGFCGTSSPDTLRVLKIQPEIVSDTIERVCIQFSRSCRPELRGLEGGRPRVFFDIEDIPRWEGAPVIAVGGRMILQVRTHLNPVINRLRIVLDLEPSADYLIEQTYYTAGDIFCIFVKSGR